MCVCNKKKDVPVLNWTYSLSPVTFFSTQCLECTASGPTVDVLRLSIIDVLMLKPLYNPWKVQREPPIFYIYESRPGGEGARGRVKLHFSDAADTTVSSSWFSFCLTLSANRSRATKTLANLEICSSCNLCIVSLDYQRECEWTCKINSWNWRAIGGS